MRPVHQGAARRARPRAARRAGAHRWSRRSRAAARAPRLIGAIVAGGANRRFGGEPKGLRTVGGVRIIDRVAGALRAVVDEVVLVANAPGAAEWLPGVRVVGDRRSERGALVGIATALDAAHGDHVLVVAWDMPFVTPALLGAIASRLTPPIAAVVPYVGPHAEGLCAAYAATCRSAADAAIARGDLTVSAFIDALPIVRRLGDAELSAIGDPARLFSNVNSAADLAAADAIARRE